MISHFSKEEFEGTLHIEDADLQKMAKVLNDVNIKECPYFDLSDKYGNSARYYRENQWIPCSERLPKEKTDVLLAFKNNMVVGFWEDILNDGSVVWYANSGDGWLTQAEADYNDGIPLAWMPLPEPWKEG